MDNSKSYNSAVTKISQLKKTMIIEKVDPSDLVLTAEYADFLFHWNLVTDPLLQRELDNKFA